MVPPVLLKGGRSRITYLVFTEAIPYCWLLHRTNIFTTSCKIGARTLRTLKKYIKQYLGWETFRKSHCLRNSLFRINHTHVIVCITDTNSYIYHIKRCLILQYLCAMYECKWYNKPLLTLLPSLVVVDHL